MLINNEIVDTVGHGIVDGSIGIILAYPFDTIKVRMQTVGRIDFGGGRVLYKNPTDCFIKMLKREGFLSFYKGISSPLISTLPITALKFILYEYLVNIDLGQQEHKRSLTNIEIFMLSLISGSVSALLLTPFERVKFYLQVPSVFLDYPSQARYVIKDIIGTEGYRGLYRGMYLTMVRDGIGCGSTFLTYFSLKEKDFLKERNYFCDEPCDERGIGYYTRVGLYGGISGIVGWLICGPVDFLKTRYQLTHIHGFPDWYLVDVIEAMRIEQIQKKQHIIRYMYTGGNINVLRAVIQFPAMFIGYEYFKNVFKNQPLYEANYKETEGKPVYKTDLKKK